MSLHRPRPSRPSLLPLARCAVALAAVGLLPWAVPRAEATGLLDFGEVLPTRGDAVSTYLHDVSEPIPGVTVAGSIVEQHRIPLADGVLLDTWVVRPPISGKVPVVLTVTPYYGGGSPVTGPLHELGRLGDELVPRGYAVGIVSVRGTGNSGGCFTIGGPSEAKDSATVIEHYARLPWSTGRVGLVGVSYDGTAPQDVWVEAPPSLKTIVPISGISDLYKYNFVNGVPINVQGFGFNTYYWGIVGLGPVGLTGGTQLRDPVSVPGAIAGEVCPEQVWVQEGGVSSTLDGNKDGYWQQRDFLAELRQDPKRPRASVFYIHGLADWNVKPHNMEGWLPAVQATGVPFKAWLGQWGHAYPTRADWWTVLTAWFDTSLKERDTGILDAPAVQVQDDDGRWRHEASFPSPASVLPLYPAAGGVLDRVPGTGVATYYDFNGNLVGEGTGDRVLFVSAPLARDVHVSGLPRFEGTVTASGLRASLMLTLVERTAEGDRPFNWAALSLNHAQSLAQGNPDIRGLRQQVGVDFFPQATVLRAGSRIVLIAAGNHVLGSDGPTLQPVSDGSTLTLELNGARLLLPVDTSLTYED